MNNEELLTRIRKEAYEQGYQDGKVEGYNLINTQIDLDEIAEAHERIGYDRGFRDGYAQGRGDDELRKPDYENNR